jgi:hypothetical protein
MFAEIIESNEICSERTTNCEKRFSINQTNLNLRWTRNTAQERSENNEPVTCQRMRDFSDLGNEEKLENDLGIRVDEENELGI